MAFWTQYSSHLSHTRRETQTHTHAVPWTVVSWWKFSRLLRKHVAKEEVQRRRRSRRIWSGQSRICATTPRTVLKAAQQLSYNIKHLWACQRDAQEKKPAAHEKMKGCVPVLILQILHVLYMDSTQYLQDYEGMHVINIQCIHFSLIVHPNTVQNPC